MVIKRGLFCALSSWLAPLPRPSSLPGWRRLCETAVVELDSDKLPKRSAEARAAVLDRIESGLPNLSEGTRLALHDVLDLLSVPQDIAHRDIGERQMTDT